MPKFKLKQEESKEVGKVTFDKSSDYKSVTLKSNDKTKLLHVVLADNLIKRGLATEAKKQVVEEKEDNMVSTKIKDNQ